MELSSLIDIEKRPSKKAENPTRVRINSKGSNKEQRHQKNTDDSKMIRDDSSKAKKISLSPKMKRRSKKRAVAKDIFQIEKAIQKKNLEANAVKSSVKSESNESNESKVKPTNEAISNKKPIKNRENKKSKHTRKRRDRSRSKRKPRNGRQIKVKSANVSEKDVEDIQKRIKMIRNKSSKEIKEDLRKSGIKVSGKSDRLLKDIYFYSKVCNLNIVHEK